ncbi:hypothetical protein FQZ97_1075910 [compost metagenome]
MQLLGPRGEKFVRLVPPGHRGQGGRATPRLPDAANVPEDRIIDLEDPAGQEPGIGNVQSFGSVGRRVRTANAAVFCPAHHGTVGDEHRNG